jgi:hypothetical protein
MKKPVDQDSPPAMKSILLAIPPEQIALFKAVIESYDNLATLRTEDPRRHHLRLWFDPALEAEVDALLDSLAPAISIRRIEAGEEGVIA